MNWMEITSECDKADYAYSIVLDGKKAVLEQVEYSEQESVEGIKFRLKDGFLFLFASAHNLIVTRSLFDLMDGTCEDYPEKEASLILCKRENDPC